MLKKWLALLAALVVPYFIFVFVIMLNETEIHPDLKQDKQVNFDVQKQKKLKKPKVKKNKKPRRKQTAQKLPSIKPANTGGSLSASGLSFGVPQFDEAEFGELQDNSLLATDENSNMDKNSVDTPPRVLRRSSLVYPELARRQGISGYVVMNVLIDEQGNVEKVELLDSDPKEIFDLQAESAIRRWKFSPASYNGKSVKVWAKQKIVFKLD